MDEYPDPDEEYELLYQEEMEALREMEEEVIKEQCSLKARRSKNSLNFETPSAKKNKENISDAGIENSNVQVNERQNSITVANNHKKRSFSTESLTDITPDLDIIVNPAKRHKSNSHADLKSHEHGTTSVKIPKWPFLSISTEVGEKLYIKINQGSSPENLSTYVGSIKSNSGLLTTPYSKLKSMAQETLSRLEKGPAGSTSDVEESLIEGSDLWVEKYKPKTYFDLLSDEAVNRTLLNWLKLWDKIVFNKEVKTKPVNSNDIKSSFNHELDKDGRPHYKIALLCGPPGLGKTTLAHVVAVLAGYNVIEVNASDERTIEALSVKLDAATQMQSVMGNRKPYCLILDEIDGAPAPTVEFLLKYLNGKINEKSKKGKKDKPIGAIKRPVICICNELYTPSLRQLRQQAFVVHFPHTSSTKLAQRLLDICRKQGIKTDLSTLTLLCDKAQNDIRSCISTLYFFKNKNGQRFKSADVVKSSVGVKDMQKGLFSLWKEIFQIPIKKGNFFSNLVNKGKEEEVSFHINYSKKGMDKLQYIVQTFQSSGDYERLVQGVFENFPKSKFSGSANSLALSLHWFTWFDLLDSSIKKDQNFILMPYLPYGFAAWHCLFSSNHFWKISYPSVGYENHLKEMRCKQILNDVLRGLSATVRSNNQKSAILLDVLPMFNVILAPPLRPVNPTLFNENEKKDYKQLIDVMLEYGLTFIQQRSADGTYFYQYDPNIDDVSRFNLINPTNTRTFSYNMRQIISHEIELERLRKTEENLSQMSSSQTADSAKDASKLKSEKGNKTQEETRSKPKDKIIKEEMQYKDFFGRVVKVNEKGSGEKAALADKNNPVKSPIWFSFKEGYNNAVKKDITIADIL